MPIDVEKAKAADLPEIKASWGPDQVILYHLGLGAGVPPTDAGELEYTYEGNLKVLPSYGVVPAFPALFSLAGVEGFDVNFAMLLHGEQDLEIHAPLPTEGEVTTKPSIIEIYDKGKGALVIVEAVSSNGDGKKLFTNRFSSFIRGEGGFGGESGPPAANEAPDREPDITVERQTTANQALLYRLSGDKNPLHADPEFAKLGGFDQPILHGLCSYGIACKAVVDEVLDGDVSKVARFQARFAGVFFPGETMTVKMWKEDGKVLLGAEAKDRDGAPVITNAAITTN